MNNRSPSSIYQQWLIAVFIFTFELNNLIACKLHLESVANLDQSIFDLKNSGIETIYWLNRQLKMESYLFETEAKDTTLPDYMNKYGFYREVSEDLTYVLLNLILGKEILDKFVMDHDFINSDEFYSKLTQVIKKHYATYSQEYQYLNQLRWLRLNALSESEILEIYWYQTKSKE